ncbi:hypothetical protein F3J37_01600 [Pantoea sp. Al-1710]|uniref:Effector protein n=1 Tax=Candidatus Pantoea communis TaxID=2608354 RepID=A0ABX0RLM6_9GAMM|nr:MULTISPECIES: M91 family zinc metallopeptidase [Pantoea]NIG12926.1 hypothetical protein [Pantoea sp. Cy-640]NIG17373.1 hypothetical protein [Pantoea communis]
MGELMSYNWSRPSKIEPKVTLYFDTEKQLIAGESALEKIKSGKNGSNILNEISRLSDRENKIDIMISDNDDNETGGELTYSQAKKYNLDYFEDVTSYRNKVIELGSNGTGVKPIIYYNPNVSIIVDKDERSWVIKDSRDAFTSLAHELIHAYHLMKGTSKASAFNDVYNNSTSQLEEEDRAVGTGGYWGNKFSENGVREDHGLPIRAEYFTQNEL